MVETNSRTLNEYHEKNLNKLLARYGGNGLSDRELRETYAHAITEAKINPDGRDEIEQTTGIFRQRLDIILMEKHRENVRN